MNVSNIKAFFFALIFLTSKIGLALNVHYCGGHIVEIVLAWNAEGCGMPSEKSQDSRQGFNLEKNHCCQDQTIFIQNNEPQQNTDYEIQLGYIGILPNDPFQFEASKTIFLKTVFTQPKPQVPRNKIFLLHQSLIFYG